MSATCWADPLTRKERRELARKLARACGEVWRARTRWLGTDEELRMVSQCILASTDMADLHMDVTERAQVATS